MEITLSGDYLQEVKFINALERDKMFFLIDGITLGEQQGNVRLQLKLETYLRGGAVS
jgi:type IV pilus assembly protein PilO